MDVTLIYPHQLFKKHPAVAAAREVLLIEDPLLFGNDPYWPAAMHQQKLMLLRASMKAYAAELEGDGMVVNYIEVPEGATMDSAKLLEDKVPEAAQKIHLADPADEVLLKRVKRFARKRGATVIVHPSPNFISPPEFLAAHVGSGKKPFMAKFYQAQRQRTGILLEKDGTATGGKWSFDTENRAKLPK